MEKTVNSSKVSISVFFIVFLLAWATTAPADEAPSPSPTPTPPSPPTAAPTNPEPAASEHGSAADVGKKLSNPLSDVWALFTEFDFTQHKGKLEDGDSWGYSTVFQPILPIPLTKDIKLITRPTIPIVWSSPVPQLAHNPLPHIEFVNKTALGDTSLPLVVAPNKGLHFGPGELAYGLGPTFTIPTSTDDALGSQKWEVGVGNILVYKTPKLTVGAFPQYWWSVGNRKKDKERPSTSHGAFLYFVFYELGDAWQIGFNPTITYNHKALKDNRWNVPVGLTLAKTFMFGKQPIKFQLGGEYSPVHQELFGKRWMIKLNIIPVIPGLIQKPLFGGK